MARRGGKAASRRSRQRRTQQRASQPAQPTNAATTSPADDEALVAPADVGSSDAFEKADAELRASTPPPGSRAPTAPRAAAKTVRARTSDFFGSGGPSRLSDAAAAEYHYVMRDLRNIGVLLVVLAVLLLVAVVLVNVLDIGRV